MSLLDASLPEDHVRFMQEALKEAKKAYRRKEVPIGAVLVRDGEILARGFNQVETLQDATAHAELLAITTASASLHSWRLSEATLYTTLEPCIMCLGALLLSRVKRVVYGAKDLRHGALGSWVNPLGTAHPTHQIEIIGGVLADEASFLMKTFFKERRDGQHTFKDGRDSERTSPSGTEEFNGSCPGDYREPSH